MAISFNLNEHTVVRSPSYDVNGRIEYVVTVSDTETGDVIADLQCTYDDTGNDSDIFGGISPRKRGWGALWFDLAEERSDQAQEIAKESLSQSMPIQRNRGLGG